jgi:hypothetical protein
MSLIFAMEMRNVFFDVRIDFYKYYVDYMEGNPPEDAHLLGCHFVSFGTYRRSEGTVRRNVGNDLPIDTA